MKDGLADVFGPVRVHINIDGADIYTSALLAEAEAHRGIIHVAYEDFKVRKVHSTPLIKKGTTYLGEDSGLNVACLDKGGKEIYLKGMLDTGATLSVMSYGAWKRLS